MADLAIFGVNMVPGNSCEAAEIGVTLIGASMGSSQVAWSGPRLVERRDEWCCYGITHRREAAAPIRIPTEMLIEMGFGLSGHRLIRVDIWAVLDVLHCQFDGEVAQRPIGMP